MLLKEVTVRLIEDWERGRFVFNVREPARAAVCIAVLKRFGEAIHAGTPGEAFAALCEAAERAPLDPLPEHMPKPATDGGSAPVHQ